MVCIAIPLVITITVADGEALPIKAMAVSMTSGIIERGSRLVSPVRVICVKRWCLFRCKEFVVSDDSSDEDTFGQDEMRGF